ncbi:DUF4395 family protein [bacterium]|nr:DUF4395 family protein [bacterium]
MKANEGPSCPLDRLRWKLQLQGFNGLSDGEVTTLSWALKVAPAFCVVWVSIGGWFESPFIVGTLIPFAFLGAVLPWHPFDVPYQWFFRRWINGPAIPSYGAPRRFACAVATVWLGAIVLAMLMAHAVVADLLIGLFVVTAMMPVLFDFCVPSFIYQISTALFGRMHFAAFATTRLDSSNGEPISDEERRM